MQTELLPEDEALAREALILKLMRGYPSLAGKVGRASTEAYLTAVNDIGTASVKAAVERYLAGGVPGQNPAFMPTAPELAEQARVWDSYYGHIAEAEQLVSYPIGELPPQGYVALGPLEVNFGEGRINMRGKSYAEKEAILTNKGRVPDLIDGSRRVLLPSLKRMNS